eukprot:7915744-Alexandrium_andersonii.AAC.1
MDGPCRLRWPTGRRAPTASHWGGGAGSGPRRCWRMPSRAARRRPRSLTPCSVLCARHASLPCSSTPAPRPA